MSDTAVRAVPKPKRLAVYLDGTRHTVPANPHLWRLRALTAAHGNDGLEQLVFYNSGLGTRYGQKFSGGMFGVGGSGGFRILTERT